MDESPLSYPDALETLEKLLEITVSYSEASGGLYTLNRGIEATKIFTRLTLSAMTINSILPGNSVNKTPLWDFPSIATLTRTFIETCHRYFYLAEDGVPADEADFRLKLFRFHLNSEKYRLYKEMGSSAEILEEFERNLPKAKLEIETSPAFGQLSKHRADTVRRGNTDMHFSDEEMATRFNLMGGRFKPLYRLLSNHTHGTPFATASQSNSRGRGLENDVERNYIALSVTLLNHYLANVIIRHVDLLSLHKVNPSGYEFARGEIALR